MVDRTYQASDLAGSARREFLDRARSGEARLRDTDGTSLLMVREGDYRSLAELRDWTMAYLMLENALVRPVGERHAADLGVLAWASVFDDDDLNEFRTELSEALIQAVAARDVGVVETVVEDWHRTARALNDPTSRAILTGETSDDDFAEGAATAVE